MFWRLQKLLLATTALAPLAAAPVDANPLGAQVVAGSASVQGQGTPTVTVTQQSNRAIINWNTFNIGAGETTKIIQPSSSSVELDRVTGGLGPSQIFGSLFSNGQVFVVNPDGILVGPGGKIDTAAFLATTHDIANSDFMAGQYNFTGAGNPAASIVNEGSITAQSGGFAALVAPGVRNSGTITATLGQIGLASANEFSLDFYGDSLITLGVNDSIAATVMDVATGQPLSSLVTNTGRLKANGGAVELTAIAARQVVDSVINNTGVIEANSIGTHNGMIVLSAATGVSTPGAPTQTVKVSGKLSAAGKKYGTTGGTVVVTGENIQVSGAKINASGQAGGGTVLIGGDTGGGNPNPAAASIAQAQLEPFAVPTATTVSVDATSVINASATGQGNGGKVVVWADQTTTFYGTIFATGGVSGGNGGFVETSGHVLDFADAWVDTSAPNGLTGSWLLDPYDLMVDAGAAATIAASLATTNVTMQTTASGSSGPGVANPLGNGDIFVDAAISWNSANSLTLSAYRNIAVDANITNTGGAAVTLAADNTGTGVGTVSFANAARVSTAGPISIFYDPSVNPAGSAVNNTSYANPTENFTGDVAGGAVLTAYMLVNTVYDLQNIENNSLGNYALGKDIAASTTESWNSGAGFIPIPAFSGIFDGQDYTINNLFIGSGNAAGLFAYNSGTIQNVGLTNVSVAGNGMVGGLVGYDTGTGIITNSYTTGAVTGIGISEVGGLVGFNYGGSLSNSYSTASVSAVNNGNSIGGLVGTNEYGGSITHSYATGPVESPGGNEAGGLVGLNYYASIGQSYATGSVQSGQGSGVGGLVGATAYSSIIESFATGNVNGGPNANAGGLIGDGLSDTITQSYATGSVSVSCCIAGGLMGVEQLDTIQQTYSSGSVSGGATSNLGALFGSTYGGVISYSYASGSIFGGVGSFSYGGLIGPVGPGSVPPSQLTSSSTLTPGQLMAALPNGFDPLVWNISAGVNSGYPYLTGNPPPTPNSIVGYQPLLPPGVAPFPNLQTAFFKPTPPTPFIVVYSRIINAIVEANQTGVQYVTSDPDFRKANQDVKTAILEVLSGDVLTQIDNAITIYSIGADIRSGDYKDAVLSIIDQTLQAALSKITVPVEWQVNKLIGVVIRDYEAGFIDSMFESVTGRQGCSNLSC